MENNTQMTIEKLQNAINTLLDAYENLQDENGKNLKKIDELEEENRSLQNTISSLESDSGKQNGAIGSMIGKIESILGGERSSSATQEPFQPSLIEENEKEEDQEGSDNAIPVTNIDDIVVNQDKIDTEKKDDIDSRMAKLLGGLH